MRYPVGDESFVRWWDTQKNNMPSMWWHARLDDISDR